MTDFEVYVPRVRNDRGIIGVTSRDFLASDIREINRALIAIDPELRKQFMRDAKAVGKEAQSLVQPALPKIAPLSGMNTRGNYGWNNQMTKKGRVPATRVSVSFKTSQGKNARMMGLQTTSLVSVRVVAPMTAISDIAGRSGKSVGRGDKGSGYSKPYTDRYGNIRRHKLNGQGQAMIDGLGGRGSRYAWPAIESSKARLEASVRDVVQKYVQIANRRFN
jgi:hypothetical protein